MLQNYHVMTRQLHAMVSSHSIVTNSQNVYHVEMQAKIDRYNEYV